MTLAINYLGVLSQLSSKLATTNHLHALFNIAFEESKPFWHSDSDDIFS